MKAIALLLLLYVVFPGKTAFTKESRPSGGAYQQKDTTSIEGKWFLQPVLPSDTATGTTPFLQISLRSKTFSGNTGCNMMRGSFSKTDSSFAFSKDIALSRRFCTGYDEGAFLRSLQRTNRYKIENGVLILFLDATELSRWTKRPAMRPLMKKA